MKAKRLSAVSDFGMSASKFSSGSALSKKFMGHPALSGGQAYLHIKYNSFHIPLNTKNSMHVCF
jgi:hypothetical protein